MNRQTDPVRSLAIIDGLHQSAAVVRTGLALLQSTARMGHLAHLPILATLSMGTAGVMAHALNTHALDTTGDLFPEERLMPLLGHHTALLEALLAVGFPDTGVKMHPLLAEDRAWLDNDIALHALLVGFERFDAVRLHSLRLAYHDDEPGDNRATTTWEKIEDAMLDKEHALDLLVDLELEKKRSLATERIVGTVERLMRAVQRSMIHQSERTNAHGWWVEIGNFYRIKNDDFGTTAYELKAPPIG